MVEFGVPGRTRSCGALWQRPHPRGAAAHRSAGRRPAWYEVGRFLGPNIEQFHAAQPDLPAALGAAAGIDAASSSARMSFGAGLVMWGVSMATAPEHTRPRPRATRPSRTSEPEPEPAGVLRPGARAAGATWSRCCTRRTRPGTSATSRSAPPPRPSLHADRLAAALAAFFLAVGIAAHALDELHGRPLQTTPERGPR